MLFLNTNGPHIVDFTLIVEHKIVDGKRVYAAQLSDKAWRKLEILQKNSNKRNSWMSPST